MTKEEKKQLQQQWREQKKREFQESLPMSRQLFEGLFDYLDLKLEEGCFHNHQLTTAYLREQGIDEEPVLAWLRKNGGYCDCEVLMNAEDKFHSPACAE